MATLRFNKKDSKSGADSYFIQIDDWFGIKLFKTAFTRDRNYDRHVEFAEIAPKVGNKITAKLEGKKWYGFIVELVNVFECDGVLTCSDMRGITCDIYDYIETNSLQDRVFDLHYGNLGRTKDGRSVVIDFSRCIDKDGFWYQDRSGYARCKSGKAIIKRTKWQPALKSVS